MFRWCANRESQIATPHPLRVQSFESEKRFGDADNKISVRVIHIYASLYRENCDKMNKQLVEKKLEIPIDKKRMTHIYVTYDSGIKVNSGH